MSDSTDRLPALFAEGQAEARPGPDCPAPEQIYEASRGALAPAAAAALLEHSVTCQSCALAFRLARAVLAEAEPAEARAPIPIGRRRWVVAVLSGMAAAAAVALVVRTPGVPVYRAEEVRIASLLGDGPLARDQFILRWSALGAGARYSVNVATPDLNVLFSRGGLTEAQLQVPQEALARLPAGGQVVWRVTALLADGRRIESTAFLTAVR